MSIINRGLANTNFAQFNEKTGNDLTLVASDATGREMLILNHRTAPDCPVAWAVRMSMSVPFVWQEVVWQKSWGAYRGRDITGNAIVDGGVLSNFPIHLLISQDREVLEIMGVVNAADALGLLIDETIEVPIDALIAAGRNAMHAHFEAHPAIPANNQ